MLQGKRGEFLSFDHIFFPSGARAYLLLFPRSKEFKQLPHHSMRPFVPFARPNASQQELVAKRENVFKIFPLEISTVSRPRVRIKKEHKKAREIRILRCRNRRATTSFRRPDCPSKQKFVSLDLQCTRERKKIKGKK